MANPRDLHVLTHSFPTRRSPERAADKGTASFSDVANAIAADHNFWLGDAFASGGSHGYDHKGMAITARGGWISVQRHFAERGVDVQTESISVGGCRDMSGYVFGNGMLVSPAIRPRAAFALRHIFLGSEDSRDGHRFVRTVSGRWGPDT